MKVKKQQRKRVEDIAADNIESPDEITTFFKLTKALDDLVEVIITKNYCCAAARGAFGRLPNGFERVVCEAKVVVDKQFNLLRKWAIAHRKARLKRWSQILNVHATEKMKGNK